MVYIELAQMFLLQFFSCVQICYSTGVLFFLLQGLYMKEITPL